MNTVNTLHGLEPRPFPEAVSDPPELSSEKAPAAKRQTAGLRLNGHAFIFASACFLALATANECQSITHLPSLVYGLVLWLWWACVASALWKVSERVPLLSSLAAKTIMLHVIAASVLAVTHELLLGSLWFMDPSWRTHVTAYGAWTSLLTVNRFGMEVLLYGFVMAITGIVRFQMQAQQDAFKAVALQKQLSTAHLRALQMQLEPHFIFNTLNAITTLVELGRNEEAASMLSHLNGMLKSTLRRSGPEKVPLSQELEMMENYLSIEQVRFADRFRVEIKVEPGALDGLVPCFLLQPIVENAIRHGIARCEGDGLVQASARREGASLVLNVRDTGCPPSKGASVSPQTGSQHGAQIGHGIGLSNTRERLAHFYDGAYSMETQAIASGGFEVAIAIPFERSA